MSKHWLADFHFEPEFASCIDCIFFEKKSLNCYTPCRSNRQVDLGYDTEEIFFVGLLLGSDRNSFECLFVFYIEIKSNEFLTYFFLIFIIVSLLNKDNLDQLDIRIHYLQIQYNINYVTKIKPLYHKPIKLIDMLSKMYRDVKFKIMRSNLLVFIRCYVLVNKIRLDLNILNSMLEPYTSIISGFENISQFKSGKEKFDQFKKVLFSNFVGMKLYKPEYFKQKMVDEIVMMLAIINKKHDNIKRGIPNIEAQLRQKILRKRQEIMQKSQCSNQQFENFLSKLIRSLHYPEQFCQIIIKQQRILYQTILIMGGKKQWSILFIKFQIQYTNQDFKKFGKEFNQNIFYLDYDEQKSISRQFLSPNPGFIYILKAKDRYLLLYPFDQQNSKIGSKASLSFPSSTSVNHKESIRFLQSNDIPAANVLQIFTKKTNDEFRSSQSTLQNINPATQKQDLKIRIQSQTHNYGNSNQKQPKISQSSIKNSQIVLIEPSSPSRQSMSQDSILFSIKVKCTVCQKIHSEIDCIYWNYLYYCYECLTDINTDTSDILPIKINKFLKDRNIHPWNYSIQCPECEAITQIKNYYPSKKNKQFTCGVCRKTVCIKHKVNVFTCFCFCKPCNIPTIYLEKLKINFCQQCRFRFCFKCQQKRDSFCKCVCKYCLSEQSKTHECEKFCHACNNKPTKLRICRCGQFICYGCYYKAMELNKQDKTFPCAQGQYI